MTRVERLMDELVKAVPAAIAEAGLRPNACILASRLGVEALRARGVRARPLSVKLSVYNAPAAAALREGRIEGLRPEDGGRVVLLGQGSDEPDTETWKGWDGHLVLVVAERYLLDLTAGQVRRLDGPHGRKPIEAKAFWIESRELARGNAEAMRGDDGACWIYEPLPDDRSFLRAAAWSGFRIRVRGDAVVSERGAPLPDGYFSPKVTVRLAA